MDAKKMAAQVDARQAIEDDLFATMPTKEQFADKKWMKRWKAGEFDKLAPAKKDHESPEETVHRICEELNDEYGRKAAPITHSRILRGIGFVFGHIFLGYGAAAAFDHIKKK